MRWYKLIFQQQQPLHIGKFEWGVVSETEVFIPGWTMWGALVNAYIVKNKMYKQNAIKQIQQKFEKITNFFPLIDGEEYFPIYNNGEFGFQSKNNEKITESEFRYEYVKAEFRTAVEPLSRQAKENHLFEFEYIIPKLSWVGLLGIEDNLEVPDQIFIGGDSRYGYGLMKRIQFKEITEDKLEDELSEWNLAKDSTLKLDSKKPIRNFLMLDQNVSFEGELKLLADFNFQSQTPVIENANYYISVGSMVKEIIEDRSYTLKKGRYVRSP